MKFLSVFTLFPLALLCCGQKYGEKRPNNGDVNINVIGGGDAVQDRFPYQVLIEDVNGDLCGGFLIAHNLVLSAASCFPQALETTLYVGAYDRTELQSLPPEQVFGPGQYKVHIHPGYDPCPDGFRTAKAHDQMVFELQRSVLGINPVKIDLNNDITDDLVTGDKVHIVGWGYTDAVGPHSDILQEAELDFIE